MDKWYFSAGQFNVGPTSDQNEIKSIVRENPGVWCWKEGMSDWLLAHTVDGVKRMKKDGITPFPAPAANMIPEKPNTLPITPAISQHTERPTATANQIPARSDVTNDLDNSSEGFGLQNTTEDIDYKIHGHEMQFVEIELDHGESAIAEAGAMMYKNADVEMETIFGDGRNKESGFMSRLLSAGSRLLTNESLFTTVFTQGKPGKGRVAFGAPYPGTITALKLSDYDGKLVCQKDSFLAGSKGVQIGIEFQKKILTGLFGGEGFIMQKLEGSGWVFVHMGGSIQKIELAPGEILHVDTGCLAAMTSSVNYDIKKAGGIKTMLFGGEGLFFAELTGPGTVWLQSLPFSRLAGRMLAAAPPAQTQGTEMQGEGSVLGSLGNLLGGR